jgi:hypothetical protein
VTTDVANLPVRPKLANQTELIELYLGGATGGAKLALSIDGDDLVSFGWYPIARRKPAEIWLRKWMYSEATGKQIKKLRIALEAAGYKRVGDLKDDEKTQWWIYRR